MSRHDSDVTISKRNDYIVNNSTSCRILRNINFPSVGTSFVCLFEVLLVDATEGNNTMMVTQGDAALALGYGL